MLLGYRVYALDGNHLPESDEPLQQVSYHALSVEVARFTEGMLVVLDEEIWDGLLGGRTADPAETIRASSRQIDLKRYRKVKRGPRKK